MTLSADAYWGMSDECKVDYLEKMMNEVHDAIEDGELTQHQILLMIRKTFPYMQRTP